MHAMPPFSHLALSGTSLSITSMMPPGQAQRELRRTPSTRTSQNYPCRDCLESSWTSRIARSSVARSAEKREDRITKQSCYRPIVSLDRSVEEGERAVHDLRDLLGVEPLAEPGRIDHVGEEYRHVLAFAFDPNLGFELVTAVQAELCPFGIGHLAAGTVHLNASLRLKW